VDTAPPPALGLPAEQPDVLAEPPQTANPEQTTSQRPELLDLLSAIKRDIEQLRAGLPLPTPPPHPAPEADAAPKKKARKRKKETLKEEWGFFDPQQSGFGALVSKLNEISNRT
jgi:hypothetical protein